jgi:serine/threonine protein phosphatase PrpC
MTPPRHGAPAAVLEAIRDEAQQVIVPSFDFRIEFSSASLTGAGRETNEDAVLSRPDLGLFGIADGMGGHAAGEVAAAESLRAVEQHLASASAREVLQRYADEPVLENRRAVFELMTGSMRAANDAVLHAGEQEAARRGMGTTLDVAVLVRDRAFFAHVGDSRAYLIRPTAALQLTHDHAAYDSLQTSGKRSPTRSQSRSPLTNSIGHKKRLVVDTLFVDLSPGDRVLLCTDGLHGMFDDEASFGRMCRQGTVAEVTRALMARTHASSGLDDASTVVIAIGKRFASRRVDAGPRARDFATIAASPLCMDLATADALSALAAGVEVELDAGVEIPRAIANDRVAYVVLEGLVELANGRQLGPSGFLMAESLLDVATRGKLPKVLERTRLIRIRHDDFCEVCAHNTRLAAELYKRLARHLASTQA